MSETPDCPEGTVEEALSGEDLLDLLAPGAPAGAAPAGPVTAPPLPDRAAFSEPLVRRARRASAYATTPTGVSGAEPDLVAPSMPGPPGAPARAGTGLGGAVPGSGAAAPVRIGSRFQPLPGTLAAAAGPATPAGAAASPAPAGAVGSPVPPGSAVLAGSPVPGLALVAAAGTPVHAVEAGTVTVGAPAGEPLRLAGESGLVFQYGGLAAGSVPVPDGARVAAGTILGTVAAPRLSRAIPAPQPHLALRILDGSGRDVDVAEFLVGLADPNELGHAAIGAGADVDPDALDREIIRAGGSAP